MIVAEQVRRLSSITPAAYRDRTSSAEFEREPETDKSEFGNELEQTRAKLAERDTALIRANQWIEYLAERGAELEQQAARDTPALQILTEQAEALAAQFAAANKRVADLEGELGAAREGLFVQASENRSLQTSLNFLVSENSRLCGRLTELEVMIDESNETRRTETNTPNTYLETALTRARVAEEWLAEVRQGLLTRLEEKRAVEHKVAVDRASARDKTDDEPEQLQNSLLTKLPAVRVTQSAPTVDFPKIREKIRALDFQLQCKFNKHAVAEGARGKPGKDCAELRDKLESDVRRDGRYSEQAEVRYTQALLATILVS
jgi:chromosome segregation ATPase